MAPAPPVPDLLISGLALGPEVEAWEASSRQAPLPRKYGGFSVPQTSDWDERQQPNGRGDPPVCGSREQRQSWYKPSKVPDRIPSGRDRRTCPHRWKHLVQANEPGSSGSMCIGQKLKVCHQLQGGPGGTPLQRQTGRHLDAQHDQANTANVARQSMLAAFKGSQIVGEPSLRMHDTEQILLTGSSPNLVPASRPRSGMQFSPSQSRPESAANSRGATPAQLTRPQSSGAQQRPPFAAGPESIVSRGTPHGAMERPPLHTRPQSCGALRSSTPVQQPQQARPKSATSAPAPGSLLRLGSTPAEMERKWRHMELRTHGGAHGFQDSVQAWEDHLAGGRPAKYQQDARQAFDGRLGKLEGHYRLPTPSQQSMSRFNLGPDTGLLP